MIDEDAITSDRQIHTRILGDAHFRFYPLWDVGAGDIMCYLCEPFWSTTGTDSIFEDEIATEFEIAGRRLALDLETLHNALKQAEEVAAQYGIFRVLIPVHYETLAHPEMADVYIRECNDLVWSVFEVVSFEINHPPADIDRDSLGHVVNLLKPFGQNILFRVESGFTGFANVPSENVLSVGMSLRADKRPEDEIINEVTDFAAQANEAGLQCHIHGIESLAISATAANSGYAYIGSDDIAPPLERDDTDEGLPQSIDVLKAILKARKGAS